MKITYKINNEYKSLENKYKDNCNIKKQSKRYDHFSALEKAINEIDFLKKR